MRLLFSLALAMSAVVAFNELHQDTPVMLAHQGAQMHSAVGDLRVLQGGKHGKGKHAALEMSSEEAAARRLAAIRWNIPGISGPSLGSRARNAVKGVAAKGRQIFSRQRSGPQGLSALGGI
ncbi:hypothetical protein AC1031_011451 [Aphanomyces cochlioides]|nr:hypothetical protein AC1031_011449 [Aphanomyces cochlioides]KAG9399638.1 hypothetical protein AC1031_011451 [Aphanomyces cochlioides]